MALRLVKIGSVFLAFLGLYQTAVADTVYLQDGSLLNGDVIHLRAGKLTLSTAYAGKLELPQTKITAIVTDEPMVVRLKQGKETQGVLFRSDKGKQQVTSAAGGEITIDVKQLADVRAPGTPSPEQLAEAKAEQAEPEDGPWASRLQLGLQGANGNTKTRSLAFQASTERKKDGERLHLEIKLTNASQSGSQTEDEIIGTGRIEHDFSDRAFVFAQTEAERDRFEDIALRYKLTIGPGYFLIHKPDQVLKLRLGFGYQNETYRSGGSDNNAILTLGYDYRVDVRQWLRLTHKLTLTPAVTGDPTEDFQVESILGAELPLGSQDSPWSLRGEYRNSYDRNPEDGIKKLDSAYLLNIVRDFK